jgi:hypothetical protein
MDVERTIEFILQQQARFEAKAEARAERYEARQAQTDARQAQAEAKAEGNPSRAAGTGGCTKGTGSSPKSHRDQATRPDRSSAARRQRKSSEKLKHDLHEFWVIGTIGTDGTIATLAASDVIGWNLFVSTGIGRSFDPTRRSVLRRRSPKAAPR